MTQTKTKKLIVWCQFFYPELISTGQVVTELFESFSKSIDIHVVCAQPTIVKADKIPLILIHSNIKVERVWSTCFSKLSLLGKICNQFTYACSLFGNPLLCQINLMLMYLRILFFYHFFSIFYTL